MTLKHQEKIVWERTFSKSDKIWHGWLYHWGHDVLAYSELMQGIMNEAIVDMAKTFREHPELLSPLATPEKSGANPDGVPRTR